MLSGDGGPAASAGLAFIGTVNHIGVVADASGGVYISDYGDNRVRKVSPDGIITTFAGKGTLGNVEISGDGGPALNAELGSPCWIGH